MESRVSLGASDRRANIRLHRVLAIELEKNGEFLPTVAVDLSITGFQVATRFSLMVGEQVKVKLYLRHGPAVQGMAEVVWSEKLELGLFRMGFQFEEMESKADFERLYDYVDKERLNAEGLSEEAGETLELASQVTLRNITPVDITHFSVLARISELLNDCVHLDEVLERALKITVEATGAERGMVLLDQGGDDFSVPAFHAMTSTKSLDYSRSVVDQVRQTGRPLLSLDAQRDERLTRSSSIKAMGTRSVLCLSIGVRERTFGMIYLDSSIRSGAFTETDLKLASVIGGMAASAIERAEHFTQLAQNEKLASLGTLMAGIMHELNNPLSSILTISEYLAQQHEEEFAHDLLEEARRCQRLVQDLLRISRKEPATFQELDLVTVVHSAVAAIQSELLRNDVDLLVEIEDSLPPVFGNADHLRQVVLNLLSNAVFAAQQNLEGRVEIRMRSDKRQVQVMVADNGPGLPQGAANRLFDPFFTTKTADRGTGLGLSIVHRIVTEHRGTIKAENRPSGGALFMVGLPITGSDNLAVG